MSNKLPAQRKPNPAVVDVRADGQKTQLPFEQLVDAFGEEFTHIEVRRTDGSLTLGLVVGTGQRLRLIQTGNEALYSAPLQDKERMHRILSAYGSGKSVLRLCAWTRSSRAEFFFETPRAAVTDESILGENKLSDSMQPAQANWRVQPSVKSLQSSDSDSGAVYRLCRFAKTPLAVVGIICSVSVLVGIGANIYFLNYRLIPREVSLQAIPGTLKPFTGENAILAQLVGHTPLVEKMGQSYSKWLALEKQASNLLHQQDASINQLKALKLRPTWIDVARTFPEFLQRRAEEVYKLESGISKLKEAHESARSSDEERRIINRALDLAERESKIKGLRDAGVISWIEALDARIQLERDKDQFERDERDDPNAKRIRIVRALERKLRELNATPETFYEPEILAAIDRKIVALRSDFKTRLMPVEKEREELRTEMTTRERGAFEILLPEEGLPPSFAGFQFARRKDACTLFIDKQTGNTRIAALDHRRRYEPTLGDTEFLLHRLIASAGELLLMPERKARP